MVFLSMFPCIYMHMFVCEMICSIVILIDLANYLSSQTNNNWPVCEQSVRDNMYVQLYVKQLCGGIWEGCIRI